MARQNYNRNEPFDTYTLQQLKTADGDDAWTWTGRTLCGYISADNYENVIPLGSEISIESNKAYLSGVWVLNTLDLSVYIDNAADDSYVNMTGKIFNKNNNRSDYYCNCLPLTDQSCFYEIKNQAKNGDICKFWFNSSLIGKIYPGTNRTISAVYYDERTKYSDSTISVYNHGEISSFMIGSTAQAYYSQPGICINEVISVFLAEGGIMHYASNKNTVNPNHPQLDN